jgi:DNA-binding transcriptional LysR family regulator
VGRKLFPVRFGVYANPTLAPRPDDARWVVLGSPLERSWLGKWEAEHVPKHRVAASTASRRLLLEMVSAGVGIGLVPEKLAVGRTDLVRLSQWNGRVAELTRQSWLLFPPALRDDARVKALMSVLTRHLSRTP